MKIKITTILGIAIVAIAIIGSVVNYFYRSGQEFEPGKKNIIFAHWSSEPGAREGIQAIIDRYEKLHPDVNIIQQLIPNRAYTNWIVTRILGETMPDLIQFGSVLKRFSPELEPLGAYLNRPNPYTSGTRWEKRPWREMFMNGLASNFNDQWLDYYSVPSILNIYRFYYNKDIFREIMGTDKPPSTWRQWLDYCRKIKTGGYIPIIVPNQGGRGGELITARIASMLNPSLEHICDLNHNGEVTFPELFYAYTRGWIAVDDPKLLAPLKATRQLAAYWEPGFNGVDIEEAKFSFIESQAAMYLDSMHQYDELQRATSGKFELGIFAFPDIGSSDPDWGEFYDGPWGENQAQAGFNIAVSRTSGYKDVAVDFLQFLTTPENCETLCSFSNWIPAIFDAKADTEMQPFLPRLNGKQLWVPTIRGALIVSGSISMGIPMQEGDIQLYLAGDINMKELLARYRKDIKKYYIDKDMPIRKKEFEQALELQEALADQSLAKLRLARLTNIKGPDYNRLPAIQPAIATYQEKFNIAVQIYLYTLKDRLP